MKTHFTRHAELDSASIAAPLRLFRNAREWILTFVRMTVVLAGGLSLMAMPALAESDLPDAPWANIQLPNAKQEADAKALMATIRCLVCQGQAIVDSNAELAGDMRSLIRERIKAGETPDAVRDWLVQRYGAWVTYDPPLDSTTWALWLAPLLFVAIGIVIARKSFRRRRR